MFMKGNMHLINKMENKKNRENLIMYMSCFYFFIIISFDHFINILFFLFSVCYLCSVLFIFF